MRPRRLSACLAALALVASGAQAITFLTEDNPPFNLLANGKVAGASAEIVAEMARRAGLPATFELTAWDDAYRRAQAEPNACVFSIARLENREHQLQWVGELATNRWAVYGRPDFSRAVTSVVDLRPLKIGGVLRDAKVEYLKSQAVTNIREVPRDDQNPPRLRLKADDPNRIDLWVTGYYAAAETARKANAGPVKLVLVLQDQPLWLACNPALDRAQVKKLADALAAMNADGSRKRILDAMEQRVAK